jgi:acylphosphatase
MHVIYQGRVQGVGFRYTVKTLTTGFEVTGTIRNLPNGQVELIAEGDHGELESFQKAVRESAVGRFIANETTSWEQAQGSLRGFTIVG